MSDLEAMQAVAELPMPERQAALNWLNDWHRAELRDGRLAAYAVGEFLRRASRASDRGLVGAQPEEDLGSALRQRAPETREETEA